MEFAQKLHSIEELEKNRRAFYKRFKKARQEKKIYMAGEPSPPPS